MPEPRVLCPDLRWNGANPYTARLFSVGQLDDASSLSDNSMAPFLQASYCEAGHHLLKVVLIQEFLSSFLFYFMWLIVRHFELPDKTDYNRIKAILAPLLISFIYF